MTVIVGSVRGKRTMATIPYKARRRCTCGCLRRATHYGLGDGVALMHGCELSVRRWMRDGVKARRVGART